MPGNDLRRTKVPVRTLSLKGTVDGTGLNWTGLATLSPTPASLPRGARREGGDGRDWDGSRRGHGSSLHPSSPLNDIAKRSNSARPRGTRTRGTGLVCEFVLR